MTTYAPQSDQQLGETQDALTLEVEEIRDLEIPAWQAENVRGASGSISHVQVARGEIRNW